MIKRLFQIIFITTLLLSCSSVEKYNASIAEKHSLKELKEDVDYAYEKLKRLHPNLYQYISKEDLEANFNQLKAELNTPLSSIEFYTKLAPVIASIGQGHTRVFSPHKRQTKKEKKKFGRRKFPFRTLRFTTIQDKIFIDKAFASDSLLLRGTELLKIEGEDVQKLATAYQKLLTGDGYTTNFEPEIARKRIGDYYYYTHQLKDSIQLSFKYKDSVFTKYIYAFPKKKNEAKAKKKSDKEKKKKLTKTARKLAKKKKRAREDWEWNHGYDKFTKESVRNFEFLDAVNGKVAYLKIRGFHKGSYEEFYDEVFKKIDSSKVDNLVIDLRDNTGGRLAEIAYINSYLTTKEAPYVLPAKMTRANNRFYPYFHSQSVLHKSLAYLLFPVLKTYQLIKVKKVNGEPHFHFKYSKPRKPKETYNYKGNLYVLTNAISFSASAVFSSVLKATKRAVLVGDETGGAFNSTVAGGFADVILPNSKEILKIGLMLLETPYKETPDGYGVKPDKYIPTTTLEKDEQLEWVLEQVAN